MVTATRPSDPDLRVRPARRPASEPEKANPAHVAGGLAIGVAAHVGAQALAWTEGAPSHLYGLIGLTQFLYLGPLLALVWRWPLGWRLGVAAAGVAGLLLNASMLHLFFWG